MSYMNKSLGDGEAVMSAGAVPSLCNLSAWLQLLIPTVLLIALLSWASRQPNFLDTGDPVTWTSALMVLWFALGLISFLRMMILKWTTEVE